MVVGLEVEFLRLGRGLRLGIGGRFRHGFRFRCGHWRRGRRGRSRGWRHVLDAFELGHELIAALLEFLLLLDELGAERVEAAVGDLEFVLSFLEAGALGVEFVFDGLNPSPLLVEVALGSGDTLLGVGDGGLALLGVLLARLELLLA